MSIWKELEEMGLLALSPTEEDKRKVGRLSADDMTEDWLLVIREKHPSLLSDAALDWLKKADADSHAMFQDIAEQRDRDSQMGAFAPLIELEEMNLPQNSGGEAATEKQLDYLRRLGVRNQDNILARLTKKDASELIDLVLKFRSENNLPT